MPTLHSIVRRVVVTFVLPFVVTFATFAGCGGEGTGAIVPPPADGGPGSQDGGPTHAGPPTIASFEATPAELPYGGGTVTLRWSIEGATAIELQGQPVTGSSTQLRVTDGLTV
jgi:hypothetical protein